MRFVILPTTKQTIIFRDPCGYLHYDPSDFLDLNPVGIYLVDDSSDILPNDWVIFDKTLDQWAGHCIGKDCSKVIASYPQEDNTIRFVPMFLIHFCENPFVSQEEVIPNWVYSKKENLPYMLDENGNYSYINEHGTETIAFNSSEIDSIRCVKLIVKD